MALGDAAFSNADIMRRLAMLERQLAEVRAARRLENATIGAGGLRVAGGGVIRSTDFDGDMVLGDAGENGWALGVERLALRGQFLGPVAFDVQEDSTSNFTITTTETTRATVTVPVPAWADQAMTTAIVTANGVYENGAFPSVSLTARARIDGIDGLAPFQAVDNNSLGHVTVSQSRLLDVSATSSFQVLGRMNVAADTWAAHERTFCHLSVTTLFRSTS